MFFIFGHGGQFFGSKRINPPNFAWLQSVVGDFSKLQFDTRSFYGCQVVCLNPQAYILEILEQTKIPMNGPFLPWIKGISPLFWGAM